MTLTNKRILVTGGTLGLGYATARLLIESGAKVAITGRDEMRTKHAAERLGAKGICADVSDQNDCRRSFSEFLDHFGGIDCLINNAGIGVHKSLLELSADEIEEVWRTNVLGAALMAQHAAREFVKQNCGDIINISSTSGLRGYESGTAYVASKFALRGMTECWRSELRKHNVRVMLINPSEVPTAFGRSDRTERATEPNKLTPDEIAYAIKLVLEMDRRGFIPELSVFATNPWG
ncbi:MAG: SDR family oxidoreductase [Bdellovibrionales bacterium]|nr:SDR family oxidoreductase [Bdellovibrionales bacterium]